MNKKLLALVFALSFVARSAAAQTIRVEVAPIPLSFAAAAATPSLEAPLPLAASPSALALPSPSPTPVSSPAAIESRTPVATPIAALTALAAPAAATPQARFEGWYDGSVDKAEAVEPVPSSGFAAPRAGGRLMKAGALLAAVAATPIVSRAAEVAQQPGSSETNGIVLLYIVMAILWGVVLFSQINAQLDTLGVRATLGARPGVTSVSVKAGVPGSMDGARGEDASITLYFADQASLDADKAKGPGGLVVESGTWFRVDRKLSDKAKRAIRRAELERALNGREE